MKNLHRRRLHRAAQVVSVVACFILTTRATPQAIAEVAAATKDHILFVGTDLSVKQGEKFYRVVGATRKTLKIEKDHKVEEVRLSGGANIKINKGVKLSNLSAAIGHIQTESIDRESARAQLAAMQASMALEVEARWQADRLQGKVLEANSVGNVWDPYSKDPTYNYEGARRTREAIVAAQQQAANTYADALPRFDELSRRVNTLLNQNLMQPSIDDEVTLDASDLPGLNLLGGSALDDSGASGTASTGLLRKSSPTRSTQVELSFDVSSPVPLENAYIVVVATYTSPGNPGEAARQISAREFAQIDSHPQKVKMTHAASINGFTFKKFDIALFANGQEVATNLSDKRLALTSDQAFQFFLIDYLSSHKGATLPPTPMLMTPRSEFRREVQTAGTNPTIYAKVDKTGNVLAMSSDAAGRQVVPASLESALQKVRFLPALENGSPVEGRAKVTLAQLTR